jgi:esterase/lipase
MEQHPAEKNYPDCDSNLSFSDYIKQCQELIAARRPDLQTNSPQYQRILDANSPCELRPATLPNDNIKRGVLLIHGLLDCPFSLRDIGKQLQQAGMLCRSILLPGHGTKPADLLNVSYHEWIKAVRYGVESLKNDVDRIYLIGYSTGATLSIYQALQDAQINSIILLSPAIRIKAPVDLVVGWKHLTQFLHGNLPWVYREKEDDYAKYLSIPFNAVSQVSKLTEVINDLRRLNELKQPMLMIMSREDETVSSYRAIDYFSALKNPDNRFLLYTSIDHRYPDHRITIRLSGHPDLHINHFSHTAIPFSPQNIHYGPQGDYPYASKNDAFTYGAYNRLEVKACNIMHQAGILKSPRHELTYNPDFDYMSKQITQFILRS